MEKQMYHFFSEHGAVLEKLDICSFEFVYHI